MMLQGSMGASRAVGVIARKRAPYLSGLRESRCREPAWSTVTLLDHAIDL